MMGYSTCRSPLKQPDQEAINQSRSCAKIGSCEHVDRSCDGLRAGNPGR
jgi:hypothetical protein